jgi:hypothetical protein
MEVFNGFIAWLKKDPVDLSRNKSLMISNFDSSAYHLNCKNVSILELEEGSILAFKGCPSV